MNILEIIGPFVFLVMGVVLFVMAIIAVFMGKSPKYPWIWCFGFLCLGVGAFGPTFIKDSMPLLRALSALSEAKDSTDFQNVISTLTTEIPDEYQNLALTAAIATAPPNVDLEKELKLAAENAKDSKAKLSLNNAANRVKSEKDAGSQLVRLLISQHSEYKPDTASSGTNKSHSSPENKLAAIENLPPTMRKSAIGELSKQSQETLKQLKLDTAKLQSLENEYLVD